MFTLDSLFDILKRADVIYDNAAKLFQDDPEKPNPQEIINELTDLLKELSGGLYSEIKVSKAIKSQKTAAAVDKQFSETHEKVTNVVQGLKSSAVKTRHAGTTKLAFGMTELMTIAQLIEMTWMLISKIRDNRSTQ